jgi:hypothetical protein
MELQAELTALQEEVGMLKGEIKAILQEVRVAILARENPFLADGDIERPSITASPAHLFEMSEPAPAPIAPPIPGVLPVFGMPAPEAPRVIEPPRPETTASIENAGHSLKASKRPIDLAALMVWVQEAAETFSHPEFVMLVTMASYADFFDEGLKQALIDMSQQITREHVAKASLADFSVALKQLESIRASSGHPRQAA